MSTETVVYGVRWDGGDVERVGTRTEAEFVGGLALIRDPDVELMVSRDSGQTWKEIGDGSV